MGKLEVVSEVTGNVWKVQAKVGELLFPEDVIVVLESMKMELPVEAPAQGKLAELLVSEKDSVDEGQIIAIIEI